ncbi:MAG: cupredoxin domain-containing protein [Paraglaciecola sp.]|nr:cupredoxin domain-containing protein [Paraglaciecola sp.]NCT47883.1 cupredoxin domain-containing protein [Paraglaciecola sp.]
MARLRVVLLLIMSLFSSSLLALSEFHLELKDHLFYPSSVTIPAGQKVKLIIHNLDDTPEEFDSFSLNREKVVFAQSTTHIYIGPLKPGEYEFYGRYNPNTARGKVVVVKDQGANHAD